MIKNYLNLIRLDKPIGSLLLLWPTVWALYIAGSGKPSLTLVIVFILGVLITRSAGCIINDYFDANFDKYVVRTKNRPIASGYISKEHALYLFVTISLLAFVIAIYFLHLKTILMSIPALFIMITYPLMKRIFALPQAYLGIAFSFGIPMVYIEIMGQLDFNTWILFISNLCWVFGYDTIYALVDLPDDKKINIKTSALTLGQYVAWGIAFSYLIFILGMVSLGVRLNFDNRYFIFLSFAAVLLCYQIWVVVNKNDNQYLKMFKLNNWVGLIIFLGIYFS